MFWWSEIAQNVRIMSFSALMLLFGWQKGICLVKVLPQEFPSLPLKALQLMVKVAIQLLRCSFPKVLTSWVGIPRSLWHMAILANVMLDLLLSCRYQIVRIIYHHISFCWIMRIFMWFVSANCRSDVWACMQWSYSPVWCDWQWWGAVGGQRCNIYTPVWRQTQVCFPLLEISFGTNIAPLVTL